LKYIRYIRLNLEFLSNALQNIKLLHLEEVFYMINNI